MDFETFKNSEPAKRAFRAMGVDDLLAASRSFGMLRRLVVDFNDCDEGRFVDAARKYAGTCSSGERVLLHAILYVTDFAWLADEFDKGHTWDRMSYVSGEHRQAVAACIAASV